MANKETIKSNEQIIGILIKATGKKKVVKQTFLQKITNFIRRVLK